MKSEAGSARPDPIDFRLDSRIAWVTGASRGVGRELALAFALAGVGATLLLGARSEKALESLAGEVRGTSSPPRSPA
jgi:short-subunit dehydrogenase